MKARVLIMAMMVAFTSFANAQEQQQQAEQQVEQQQLPKVDKRTEFRVKKMTERLLLDDAKAAKFAPLYQEYLEARATCRPELVFGEKLTDAQLEANMEAMLNVREKAVDIDKKYYKKFSKLLNAKQLDMIFGLQAQFGQRPMKPGKAMHAMPQYGFGKPGAPRCKAPRMGKRGDFKKAAACKKNNACDKAVDCKDCEKKAECKKECKQDGKCNKVEACVTATECENAAVCDKAADSQE